MARRTVSSALAMGLALSAAACATGSHYAWGGYDQALHAHYRAPQDREAWVARLEAIIRTAEAEGLRVPPGIYAEYGYALFEEGRAAEAIPWFEKEKARWPESRLLMDKLIRNAGQRGAPPAPTTGPAGALERTP